MKKYEIATMKFAELKDTVLIPPFQRGLVWNNEKKKNFIGTLKSGLPIGVLLLKEKDGKYLIVDGLQRFTTMKDYSNDYFKYIKQEEITEADLIFIIESVETAKWSFSKFSQDERETILNNMRHIIVNNVSHREKKNLYKISKSIAVKMCENNGPIKIFSQNDSENVHEATYDIIEKLENNAKIDDIEIPLILFMGEDNELADVYQRLNQGGSKLLKYDVFSATWIDHFITIKNDSDFIDYVIKKYEKSQNDSNLEVANFDPVQMKKSGQLTVFEYAFALGKFLIRTCPILFPQIGDDGKIEEIGFNLLTSILGLPIKDMEKLASVIEKHKELDCKELKDAIREACCIVQDALTPYIISPSPKTNKKSSLACHSEYQIASLILVVFKLKYNISSQGEITCVNSPQLRDVQHYMYKHYLYDILNGYWAGTGDSKMEKIVSNPSACRYIKDVPKEQFENVISTWLTDMNQKSPLKNVSSETKLFLNYLLRGRVYNIDRPNSNFDIEHCVPKKVFEMANLCDSVPVSSACNLVYIPMPDNRRKKDKTYYQKQDISPTAYSLDEKQLDKYVYPKRDCLRFVESTSTITEENYRKFLESRVPVVLEAIMGVLYEKI